MGEARPDNCDRARIAYAQVPVVKLLVTGGPATSARSWPGSCSQAGHEVVVLDNLERGHREAVPPEARLVVGRPA